MTDSRVASLAALLQPSGDLAQALGEALNCARTKPGGHEVTEAIIGALDALGVLQRLAKQWAAGSRLGEPSPEGLWIAKPWDQ